MYAPDVPTFVEAGVNGFNGGVGGHAARALVRVNRELSRPLKILK